MIEELKQHLKNTPKEQLKKEWEKVNEYSNIGPSALKFIANQQNIDPEIQEIINKNYWELL